MEKGRNYFEILRNSLQNVFKMAIFIFIALGTIAVATSSMIQSFRQNCRWHCNEIKYLCSVDCSGISIEKINVTHLEELPKVQINLNLRHCQIEYIPYWLTNFNIRSLDLSHNNISFIDNEVISGIEGLEKLDVSHNILGGVNLLQSETLTELRMTHNDIRFIEKSNFECPKLELLDLSHNLINNASEHTLPDNLKILLIANNSIKSLDLSFLHLQTLDVTKNGIFELKMTTQTSSLKNIRIKGNTLKFNCENAEFRRIHRFLQGKIQDTNYDNCLKQWNRQRPSDYGAFWLCFLAAIFVIIFGFCFWGCVSYQSPKTDISRPCLPHNPSSQKLIDQSDFEGIEELPAIDLTSTSQTSKAPRLIV